MAKTKDNNKAQDAPQVATENVEAAETDAQAKERTKRGESLSAQIKTHFLEILGEFVSSGQVANQTLQNAVAVFEQVPMTSGIGIPLDVQLKNIEDAVAKMFDSKNIDQDELRRLLNRKQRIQKALAGDTEETAAEATA